MLSNGNSPKSVWKVKVILIMSLTEFSLEIYMEKQGGSITFKKNNMGKGLSFPNRCYKVVIIKTI